MIKQLIVGLMVIIIITVIMFPITFVISEQMEALMTAGLLTTILVTIVRYFGFFYRNRNTKMDIQRTITTRTTTRGAINHV